MNNLSTKLLTIFSTTYLLLCDIAFAAQEAKSLRILGYDFKKNASDLSFLDIIYFILYLGRNLIGIAGFIAIIYIMVGGFTIVASSGNQDQVQKGKNTLTYAVIGFVVALTAYILVDSFLKYFTGTSINTLPTQPSS